MMNEFGAVHPLPLGEGESSAMSIRPHIHKSRLVLLEIHNKPQPFRHAAAGLRRFNPDQMVPGL